MKLIVDNILFSLQKVGGASVVWFNHLKKLSELNYDYGCIEYRDNYKNIFWKRLNTINIFKICRTKFYRWRRYIPERLGLKDPYIFISTDYRYSKDKSAINVTLVHDFTYEKYFKGISKYIHIFQKYRAIKHSEYIICISNSTKNDLLYYLPNIDPSKIVVIYNGFSTNYHLISREKRIKELSNYILFVGARSGYKNFDFVVKCIAKTSFNIAICGKNLTTKENALLLSYLSKDRIKIYNNVPDEMLNIIYNSVYALAYPSSYEGFGIPVLEAQAAGCPVIAMNISSIPEVAGDTTLLMDELSEDVFIEKINMLRNKEIRNSVIKNGLNNVKRFSWNKCSTDTIKLFNKIKSLNR